MARPNEPLDQPDPAPGRRPARWWRRLSVLLNYAAAGVAYIALGLVAKEVFAWWAYGMLFLLAWMWLIPAAVRRLRR